MVRIKETLKKMKYILNEIKKFIEEDDDEKKVSIDDYPLCALCSKPIYPDDETKWVHLSNNDMAKWLAHKNCFGHIADY